MGDARQIFGRGGESVAGEKNNRPEKEDLL